MATSREGDLSIYPYSLGYKVRSKSAVSFPSVPGTIVFEFSAVVETATAVITNILRHKGGWRAVEAAGSARRDIMDRLIVRLLLLHAFIADQRNEYAKMETEDVVEQAFAEGIIAACEFFEEALEHMMYR